ncbi:MAG: nitroreductase family protein, partial [Thermodesulfovibrionia bacterium]|nr:nitroreductase family protein [Thermodesulfovibrionia bacterium]
MKRRSIRKFKDKLIAWDNIVAIVNSGMNAPVAGNVFNTKFIVVRELANKKALADACHHQSWIATAPVIIAIIAEPEHQKRFYGSRGEKLYTIQNAAACATNMIIAAESLGFGSCWIGSFDEDKLRNVLGLPEQVNVHAILAIGYADEVPKKPSKPWIKTTTYLEKWWGGRKLPAYGYYSENVMKVTKKAGEEIKKAGKGAG